VILEGSPENAGQSAGDAVAEDWNDSMRSARPASGSEPGAPVTTGDSAGRAETEAADGGARRSGHCAEPARGVLCDEFEALLRERHPIRGDHPD
jgi:hypothetical protein